MTQTVGFIGLGNMGGPMAANLVKAGWTVVGYDRLGDALAQAEAKGVVPAANPTGAVEGVDVLITMLPAGEHVLAVYDEVLAACSPGTLCIDSSTIDVASARLAHGRAEARGLMAVDAPVSGGVGGAEAATLTFMAGGTPEAFAKAEPLLAAMGKRSVHCGGAGAGQAAKICNNMILGVSMIGVCEAFALGQRLGLTPQALFDVASTSSGQCWSITTYCPVPGPVPTSPANRGYAPGFATALMAKDLKLAQAAAQATGSITPLGAQAAQLYALFEAAGHGGRDFSAMVEFLQGGGGPGPGEAPS